MSEAISDNDQKKKKEKKKKRTGNIKNRKKVDYSPKCIEGYFILIHSKGLTGTFMYLILC